MGGPPPLAPPPGAAMVASVGLGPSGPLSAAPEQHTIMGQMAPVLPPAGSGPRPGGSASRTQAIDGGGGGGGLHSTVYVPGPPTGMTMSPQATAIRQHVLGPKPVVQKNPKPLFWVGWALLGVCLGMLLHIIWN